MKRLVNLILFLVLIGYVSSFDFSFLKREDSCKFDFVGKAFTRLKEFAKELFGFKPDIESGIKFLLYTKKNLNNSQELKLGDKNSVKISNFDPKNPVRILIHGFWNSGENCFSVLVRNAYLQRKNFINVVVVDWSDIAQRTNYTKVVNWLHDVAKVIKEFTVFLNTDFKVPFDNMYLIGHSLGAHLAGYAGKELQPLGLYNTIFGLDPAGPKFNVKDGNETKQLNISRMLHRGDAQYVETITTDMYKFGYKGHLGNASFYPNFAKAQNNCKYFDLGCSHSDAYIYFAATIYQPKTFMAKSCDSFENILNGNCVCKTRNNCQKKSPMGGEPSTKKNGIFYLNITMENYE